MAGERARFIEDDDSADLAAARVSATSSGKSRRNDAVVNLDAILTSPEPVAILMRSCRQ